jgi:glycosyltransferase involved in cell wall biosynthesis
MCELSKLRICCFAGTLGQGGAERQLFYTLQALRQSGAAASVLCLDRGAFWEEPIRRLGIPVTWVGQSSSRLKRLFRITKELKKNPADIIQSQHFYTNVYASLPAMLLNIGGVGAMRSNGASEVAQSGRFGGRLNLRLPKILAANSKTAIRYAIEHGVPRSRLYFLPNVVDTEQFYLKSRVPNRPVTLVAVGRLTREKRLDRFLSILARLRTEHQLNVRGLIVGPTRADQDLRPKLEEQAARLGLLPDGVQFRGSVSDMASVFGEAEICVLTSDYEGTPNVLLEAMASGLPVVATRVGGVPDIIREGQTGFLLAPDDLDGQAAALVELIRNVDRRREMGNMARSYVELNHSMQRLPGQLEQLYRRALPAARKAASADSPLPKGISVSNSHIT